MGYHASMDWMEKRKEERGNIQKYYPEAKSVISLGLNYYTNKKQSDIWLTVRRDNQKAKRFYKR